MCLSDLVFYVGIIVLCVFVCVGICMGVCISLYVPMCLHECDFVDVFECV